MKIAVLACVIAVTLSGALAGAEEHGNSLVINELVITPQRDWNDSGGGNKIPFDSIPGPTEAEGGDVDADDQYIEIFNGTAERVYLERGRIISRDDHNGAAWEYPLEETSGQVFRFTLGSSLKEGLLPGGRLLIGNPGGSGRALGIYGKVTVELPDQRLHVFVGPADEGTGAGGRAGGDSDSLANEALARVQDGRDTGSLPIHDYNDFTPYYATPLDRNYVIVGRGVIVSEIMFNGPGTYSEEYRNEYVELWNFSSRSVDLNGYFLADSEDCDPLMVHPFAGNGRSLLAPHTCALIMSKRYNDPQYDPAPFYGELGSVVVMTPAESSDWQVGNVLSNDGEEHIALFDASGKLRAAVLSNGGCLPPSQSADGYDGWSWRKIDCRGGDTPNNWELNDDPTPGYAPDWI